MSIAQAALEQREREGRPIRVGLVASFAAAVHA